MKKVVSLVLALMLVLGMCAVSFADTENVTVAVIYADTVDDKGWCQAMDTGIQKVIAAGYAIDYTPVESVAIPDAGNVLDQLVGEYDIIIVHGAQFMNACTEVAAENPDQIFVLGTTNSVLGDNIFSYMPMSEEPGYVNGIIAGMMTKANKVGLVGSSDNGDAARFDRGFVLGVKSVNPDCEVMSSWTGSFSDTVGAGDIATTFAKAGCDVMTGSSQQAVGGIRIAQSEGNIIWLGQTLSQMNDFAGTVIAAADYDYSAVLIQVIEKMAEGITGGMLIPMNYNNNGFVYDFSEAVPEDVKAAAEAALAALTEAPDTIDYTSVEF